VRKPHDESKFNIAFGRWHLEGAPVCEAHNYKTTEWTGNT